MTKLNFAKSAKPSYLKVIVKLEIFYSKSVKIDSKCEMQ